MVNRNLYILLITLQNMQTIVQFGFMFICKDVWDFSINDVIDD